MVGTPTVEAIIGNKIAPSLLDAYLARTCFDSQMTREPEVPDRPDNLWKPVDAGIDHGRTVRFDRRSRGSSLQLWANMNRGWLVAAGGGLATIACAALLERRRRRTRGVLP